MKQGFFNERCGSPWSVNVPGRRLPPRSKNGASWLFPVVYGRCSRCRTTLSACGMSPPPMEFDGWGATECDIGARIRVKGGFRRFAIFRTSADERRFLQEAVKIVQHGTCAKLSDITGLNFLILSACDIGIFFRLSRAGTGPGRHDHDRDRGGQRLDRDAAATFLSDRKVYVGCRVVRRTYANVHPPLRFKLQH